MRHQNGATRVPIQALFLALAETNALHLCNGLLLRTGRFSRPSFAPCLLASEKALLHQGRLLSRRTIGRSMHLLLVSGLEFCHDLLQVHPEVGEVLAGFG